jgi:EAL domain-containing protein (putative c-di-GMP-specific phosphodiesterase class I)
VRWQHPEDGLVYPDQFIGIAEEHGMIDDLTHLVLAAALRQGGAWHAGGLPIQVAVNVSMDNLGALDLPDRIERDAAAAGMPLADLVLEVTESCLMKNPLASLDILTRLRLKNIGLSIDDFGTGHSSLAQLRDIPFTELKIDRSFVHGASRNPYMQAILEANLGLARQLGMKTVAEGVENEDDWHLLRACGCDVAQGYLVARPMAAADLPGWLEQWESRRGALMAGITPPPNLPTCPHAFPAP